MNPQKDRGAEHATEEKRQRDREPFMSKKPWVAIGLVTAALGLRAMACDAATWGPAGRIETRYDDNVFHRADPAGDLVTTFAPEFDGLGTRRVFPWALRARRTFMSYGRAPSLAFLSERAIARAAFAPTSHDSIGVNLRYTRSHDPLEFEDRSVLTRGDAQNARGAVQFDLARGEGAFRYNQWRYHDTDQREATSRGWMLGVFPYRDRTSTWVVEARGQNLDVQRYGSLTSTVAVTG